MAVIVPCIKKILLNKENRIWLFMYFIGLILLVWTRNIEILFTDILMPKIIFSKEYPFPNLL